MGATVVSDEAEQKIVAFADRVFPAFMRYRRDAVRANRTIPIVQLARRQSGDVR